MGEGLMNPQPAFGRRMMIAGGMALLAAPATAAVPPTGRIAFDVIRQGTRIGSHALTFTPSRTRLDVAIEVDITVRLLSITVYSYSLRGMERWQDGQLVEAASNTQDGGDKSFMRAIRRDGRLHVEGSHGKPYIAPAGSICATHWNPRQLDAPMVNVQDGELLDFKVAPRGTQLIEARGRKVEARHFALTGPAAMELWYDQQQVWSQLRAVVRDGSIVEYRAV
jgi:hypothetical protein